MQATLFAPAATNFKAPANRQELLSMVWENGGNQPPVITFHEDPGHGWLQVPKALLKKMGIQDKITAYSYQRGPFAYLEEDCDLSTFVLALNLPDAGLMPDFWQVVPRYYKENTPIRNYNRYNSKG